MKYRVCVLLAIAGSASVARADLLVGVENFANSSVPSTVLKFDNSGNLISTFNPGWLEESVQNVAVSPTGNVYSLENSLGGALLTQLNPATGSASNTYQPTDSHGNQAELPTGLTVGPEGYIYVASNKFIQGVTSVGVTNVFRVNPADFTSSSLYLSSTTPFPSSVGDLVFGPDSNLYFVDFGNEGTGGPTSSTAIWKYNTKTQKLNVLVSSPPILFAGGGIAFGPNGNLFLCGGASGVLEYNPTTGSSIATFVANGSGGLNGADDLAFAPDGSLYVSDGSDEILRYNGTTGAFLNVALSASDLSDAPSGTWEISSFAIVPEPATMFPLIAAFGLLSRRFRTRPA
jgi:streptogramin lyase